MDSTDEPADRPGETAPSSAGKPKVVVVMPALNAARTLKATVEAIPRDVVDEVVLVDDGSSDATVEIARTLPLHVIWHPHNVGYGGNQKTCYLHALQVQADIVVMLHPDGQYPPDLIPQLIQPIVDGRADFVLGSRFLTPGGAREGGMPAWKQAANRLLTKLENSLLGTDFSEMHTGYRAYSSEVLKQVPFLRNSLDFSFDSEMLMQAVHFDFRIAEVPCSTHYDDTASSVSFTTGVVYGLKTLETAVVLRLHRLGVLRSKRFVR
jgi:glycosyltransferase involved in cell wall biosynthesis